MSAPPIPRLAPRDVFALGLAGMRGNPFRAILSAIGISIGIGTMTLVTGLPASSNAALQEHLDALGADTLRVDATSPDGAAGFPPDALARLRRIGPIEAAAAVGNTHATVRRSMLVSRDSTPGISVLATSSALPSALRVRLRAGRFLDRSHPQSVEVVLGRIAAERLGTGAPQMAGTTVTIGETAFRVVGVLDSMPLAPDLDRAVFVSDPVATRVLHYDGQPSSLYLRVDQPQLDAVRTVLPATLTPGAPGGTQVSRPTDVIAAKAAAQSSSDRLYLGLAAVALLVGGVGVANTMLVSVLERRSEIGLRRALGARRSQITMQFLTEAITLSIVGGLAGSAIGTLITVLVALAQGWPPVVPIGATAVGVAASVVVGALAGLHPARQAAAVSPSQALSGT